MEATTHDLLRFAPDPFAKVVLPCPRALVGRLIGRSGVTIKGLQLLTGTVIEIDQKPDPSQVIVLGATADATKFALSIIEDIIAGNFKGFALLRDVVASSRKGIDLSGNFVYAPGIGLLPRRQLYVARPKPDSNDGDGDDGDRAAAGQRDNQRVVTMMMMQEEWRASATPTAATTMTTPLISSQQQRPAPAGNASCGDECAKAAGCVSAEGRAFELHAHPQQQQHFTVSTFGPTPVAFSVPDPSAPSLGLASSLLLSSPPPTSNNMATQQTTSLFFNDVAALRNHSSETTASSSLASADTMAAATAATAAAAAAVVTGHAPCVRLIIEMLNKKCV